MIVDKTRELQVKAKLYILYNETPPIAAGYYTLNSSNKDPENNNPINKNTQQDRSVTLGGKKYNTTPSFFAQANPLSNGHLPPVNQQIGAPRCTFAYGSIEPGQAHPKYNLLKGPTEQYSPNFVGSGSTSAESQQTTPVNPNTSVPFMPYKTNNPFGASQVLTTYNIWALVDSKGNLITTDSSKYRGQITNPANGEPDIQHLSDSNGESFIQVNSTAAESTVKRIFPLSKDVIYDNDSTLYAVKNLTDANGNKTSTIVPQKVTEKGGENNSFHLTINSSFMPSNVNGKESKIIVTIGYASKKYNNTAFQYEITAGNIEFYLITVSGQKLKQRFNRSFTNDNDEIKTQQFNLYMHFLKDIVLIGSSPNNWDALAPPSQQKNSDSAKNKYINFLPSDATITIQCNYASCNIQYGPLAFNNFDTRYDDHTPHVTFSNESTSPTYELIPYDGYKNVKDNGISYYPDARSGNNQLEFVNSYINDGYGQVKFNSVIGGPILTKVENNLIDKKGKPTYTAAPDNSLLIPIGGQDQNKLPAYDISEYIESWDVTYENGESRLIFSTASVTLKNFDAGYSQDTKYNGMNILSLIEKNMIVIELSAGYNDELSIFFQGFIMTTSTQRSASGSVTTLNCSDVGKVVLETTRFQNYVLFSGSKIKNAIYRCFEHSGFYPYFRLYENPGYLKSINANIANTQLEGKQVQCFQGTTIISKIQELLDEFMTKQSEMPFLRFDYSKQVFEMDWRYASKYRDELKLFGVDLADANTRDIYFKENLEDWHGLLSGPFTVSTENGNFFRSFEVRGSGYEGFISSWRSYSQVAAKDSIISGDFNVKGYVGYDKKYYYNLGEAFPDWLSVNTYLTNVINTHKNPIYNISFDCYVKRPLNNHGSFIIKSMMKENARATDAYIYKTVRYQCNKKDNTIIASVTGAQAVELVK